MRRTVICAAVLAAALLTLPAAALAADQTIFVGTGRTVSPADVTIAPGETVSWNWRAGTKDDHHIMSDDQSATTENWDFGVVPSGSSGVKGTHTFTKSGAFRYHCAIHPSLMFGIVTVTNVSVQPAAPTPGPGFVNEDVTFTASASSPGRNIDHYEWAFGDGTTATTSALTPTATHPYTATGTFTAKVTAVDDQGDRNDASQSVSVLARGPAASF